MDYQEALAFLQEASKFGMNLGLERIKELLKRLGDPQACGIKYVHVGGTNGKGSTAAFVASILQAAGFKVGVFSSPHLHSYCERMKINWLDITEDRVADLLSSIKPYLAAMVADGFEPPTEFEISTAVAFCYFAQENVAWVVLEVGLGGELDATNVIVPEVSIITNVALDHVAQLGKSIEAIAKTKAGIIKENQPVISGVTGVAEKIIKERVNDLKATLYLAGRDFCWQIFEQNLAFQIFSCSFGQKKLENLKINFLGRHQVQNAALAVATAILLNLSEDAIRKGLEQTKWPGRLEILCTKPLVLLDGAHNVHGMRSLSVALTDYWPNKKPVAVLSMLGDKDRENALAVILPHLSHAVITRPPSIRAKKWDKLADICRAAQVPTEIEQDIKKACQVGLRLAKEKNEMLLVTGSLYMLAEARQYLPELLKEGNY